MKILLSAFACDPNHGSEPGVGWAWACQIARAGHDVCVFTRIENKPSIEAALAKKHIPRLRFVYLSVPNSIFHIPSFGIYPYYFAWQLKAYLLAGKLVNLHELDCIHHITYGTYRTPFFLSFLGVPSIFGPVGGGEVSPIRLTKGMPILSRMREGARIAINRAGSLNPLTRLVWRHSSLILAVTDETLKMVPKRYRSKCRLLLAVTTPGGAGKVEIEKCRDRKRFRVLFVGRLLEWKGPHLALKAISVAKKTLPTISLTIIGNGRFEPRLRKLVKEEGLTDQVQWIPHVTRRRLLEVYDEHEVLIFSNLRDAGGTVVLEAMSRGVPVICLKLGAFGNLIDSDCGACIETDNRSIDDVVEGIAAELVRFSAMSESDLNTIRRKAYDRSLQFNINDAVLNAYTWFAELNGVTNLQSARSPVGEKIVG
jgi:glycosyltransferase involved in cell wall biosynthesis